MEARRPCRSTRSATGRIRPRRACQPAEGPFRTTTTQVTGPGFAGGVLHRPQEPGRYGGIVLVPPFLVNSSALRPFAQRYASNGFVVLALDARSTSDQPSARANQARAALAFLKQQDGVDPDRMAVGGYSMGGGASLELAASDPTLRAAVPMVPWHTTKSFPGNRVPTLILGGQSDTVAPVSEHASRFYGSIPASTPKILAVVEGGTHYVPTNPPPGITQLAVAWMKYWVDGDSRYRPFITRPDGLSDYRAGGLP